MLDTEKAIELLEEHMPPLEDYGEMIGAPPQYCGIKYVYNDPCGYAFETAIQALQEKAEREKGCTYCNEKTCENCGQGNQSYCDNCKHQKSWCDREVSFKYWAPLNKFCPMCGRKLNNAPTDNI